MRGLDVCLFLICARGFAYKFESQPKHFPLEDAEKSSIKEIDLMFSQWILGQVHTCDCALARSGGIKTRELYLKRYKKRYPDLIVVDSGNFIFPKEYPSKLNAKKKITNNGKS